MTRTKTHYIELELNIPDDNNVYVISDTHFGHENIIRYCNRPFESLFKMNETMVQNWREIVKPEDYVLFMGDFVMGQKKRNQVCNFYHSILYGNKYMLRGNHDSGGGLDYRLYNRIYFNRYGKRFVCQHYPIDPKEVGCDIAIVGHTHNNVEPDKGLHRLKNQLNVSVELIDYKPLLLTEDLIDEKNWT